MTAAIRNRKTFESSALKRALDFLAGDRLVRGAGRVARDVFVPLAAIALFLLLWSAGARQVQTSLGELPGPGQVWEQGLALYDEHKAEREREAAFYERMQVRIDKAVAAGKPAERIEKMQTRRYTGAATFVDQIFTSLWTVMAGFALASLIAIPLGIVIGMSQTW